MPSVLVTDDGYTTVGKLRSLLNGTLSSLYHSQSSGLAERIVKTLKQLLQDLSDLYKVLMSYRATLLSPFGPSPAKLLMGWKY